MPAARGGVHSGLARERLLIRSPIALPTGHFMGLAPLDVWVRLLLSSRRGVRPRYWLRLACAVGTSALATAITLPERLLLAPYLFWRFRGPEPRFVPRRDTICIVGYFRSGTTHLHNLLATHPDLATPKWVQAMSPQGFWLSWAFLRLALVPFLPNKRPQDDVAFGPDWPAEDDFAHNNWALASSLPGRLVMVGERERWAGFDSIDDLPESARSRWRRAAAAFCWKVSRARAGKALLLKSPSHTGKAAELDRLFGGRARFVHIARDPEEVVRSNVAMHARLEGQSLQPMPDPEATREAVIGEYLRAESRFLSEAERLGERAVRVWYTDLVGDPIGELARVCQAAGLRWDDAVRDRAARYLEAVGDYKPRRHAAQRESDDPRLAELAAVLGLDQPREANGETPLGAPDRQRGQQRAARSWRGVIAVWVTTALGLALWLFLAHEYGRRFDVLAWPLGGLVGVAALRVAGRGDWKLGLWAAFGAFALVAGSVWPLPEIAHGWTGEDRLRNLSTAYGTFNNNYLYLIFGMLTAYRYASRRFPRPPGM